MLQEIIEDWLEAEHRSIEQLESLEAEIDRTTHELLQRRRTPHAGQNHDPQMRDIIAELTIVRDNLQDWIEEAQDHESEAINEHKYKDVRY